jgi:hypothetical protein
MGLVDPAAMAGKALSRVYIAGRRAEAQRVEATLSASGIDYIVGQEPFRTRLLGLLPVEYQGVAFSVLSGQADVSRRVLAQHGLVAGLVEDDAP